jgi:hypothetical protein
MAQSGNFDDVAYNYYKYLTVTKGLVDVRQIMQIVDEQHAVYNALFHHTDTFNVAYRDPQITIAGKLQCLENFDRIDPLPLKCGVMLTKCSCNDSNQKICCVHSFIFSMLFSPNLVVPSTDCSKQLKETTKDQVNSFHAAELRNKNIAKEKGVIPEQPMCAPQHSKIQRYDAGQCCQSHAPCESQGQERNEACRRC